MANVKISGLPAASTLTGAELVPIVQSGVTTQTTASSFGATGVYTPSGTGAVPTTIQTKLRETVSVKDFNADSTGLTDSSTAINLAVDYLNGIGGGTLFFPAGTYKLQAASIKLRSNIKYIGAGIGNTIISLSTDGTYYPSGFTNYPASTISNHVVISDLTINGNYDNVIDNGNDNYQHGIYANFCSDSIFERIEFKNIWYVGIEIYNNNNRITVNECIFSNVGDKHTIVAPTSWYYCIGVDFSNNTVAITNNKITNCGGAINMFADNAECNNITIIGNQFKNISGVCIYGRNGVKNVVASNNVLDTAGYSFFNIYDDTGIPHNGGYTYNITVSDNIAKTLNTNGTSGSFAIAVSALSGVVITNNTITDVNNLTGSTGGILANSISGQTTSGALISGNSLEGKFNSYSAIRINGSVTDSIVSGNYINGNTVATGIAVISGALRTRVVGNQYKDCATNVSNAESTAVIEDGTIAYTPTWTSSASPQPAIGNGSITGSYARNGNTVTASIILNIGSTTTFGTNVWFFSFPVTPISGRYFIGSAYILGTSNEYSLIARIDDTVGIKLYTCAVPAAAVGAATPAVLASGNKVVITITYEV
jgi:hypothetical protein